MEKPAGFMVGLVFLAGQELPMGDLKCSIILKAKSLFNLIVLYRLINLNEGLKFSLLWHL